MTDLGPMEAYLDEGGKLSHENAMDLLRDLKAAEAKLDALREPSAKMVEVVIRIYDPLAFKADHNFSCSDQHYFEKRRRVAKLIARAALKAIVETIDE